MTTVRAGFLLAYLLLAGAASPVLAAFHLFPLRPCELELELLRFPEIKWAGEVAIITPRLLILKPAVFGKSFTLIARDTHRVVGSMALYFQGQGIVHISPNTDPLMRGQGLMTEAKYAGLKYAFEKMGATVSEATTASENVASNALHIKLGYRQVPGRLPGILNWKLSKWDFKAKDREFQRAGSGYQQFLPKRTWKVENRRLELPDFAKIRDFQRQWKLTFPGIFPDTIPDTKVESELALATRALNESAEVWEKERQSRLAVAKNEGEKRRIDAEFFQKITAAGQTAAEWIFVREIFLPQSAFQRAIAEHEYEQAMSILGKMETWGTDDDWARFAVRKLAKEMRRQWLAAELTTSKTTFEMNEIPKSEP